MREPSELDYAIAERHGYGVCLFGPLTLAEQETVDAYDLYLEEAQAEHEATERAGGRTICPQCGLRSVTHRTVVTYGYEGHPGADYSDLATCESPSCDYMEV